LIVKFILKLHITLYSCVVVLCPWCYNNCLYFVIMFRHN